MALGNRERTMYWFGLSCGSYQKVEKAETKPKKKKKRVRLVERERPDVG